MSQLTFNQVLTSMSEGYFCVGSLAHDTRVYVLAMTCCEHTAAAVGVKN